MKRSLSILIILLLILTGCSSGSSDYSNKANSSDSAIDNYIERNDKVILDGVFSTFDIDEISRLSGYTCSAVDHMPEEVLLKLLAEDSDVDIYFLPADTVLKIKEKGIYYTIESEIVKDFNNSCFDHMRDVAINDNGDTVGMVVDSSSRALIYPVELEEETGVDIQGLVTLEDYLGFIEGYTGEREGYISFDDCFYDELLAQYEKYYCDFANKKFDYDTDLYKSIFVSTLLKRNEDGRLDSFYGMMPIGYNRFAETYMEIDKLFMADASYLDVLTKSEDMASRVRAIPLPRINEDCKNSVSATYALINPHSKNIEGAVKVLETIAQNRDDVGCYYGKFPIIYKNISDYSDEYMTDTAVFKDFFSIAENGFIIEHWLGSYQYRKDVDDYRTGVLTADEAIAEYRRMIDIWLNE